MMLAHCIDDMICVYAIIIRAYSKLKHNKMDYQCRALIVSRLRRSFPEGGHSQLLHFIQDADPLLQFCLLLLAVIDVFSALAGGFGRAKLRTNRPEFDPVNNVKVLRFS